MSLMSSSSYTVCDSPRKSEPWRIMMTGALNAQKTLLEMLLVVVDVVATVSECPRARWWWWWWWWWWIMMMLFEHVFSLLCQSGWVLSLGFVQLHHADSMTKSFLKRFCEEHRRWALWLRVTFTPEDSHCGHLFTQHWHLQGLGIGAIYLHWKQIAFGQFEEKVL